MVMTGTRLDFAVDWKWMKEWNKIWIYLYFVVEEFCLSSILYQICQVNTVAHSNILYQS